MNVRKKSRGACWCTLFSNNFISFFSEKSHWHSFLDAPRPKGDIFTIAGSQRGEINTTFPLVCSSGIPLNVLFLNTLEWFSLVALQRTFHLRSPLTPLTVWRGLSSYMYQHQRQEETSSTGSTGPWTGGQNKAENKQKRQLADGDLLLGPFQAEKSGTQLQQVKAARGKCVASVECHTKLTRWEEGSQRYQHWKPSLRGRITFHTQQAHQNITWSGVKDYVT